MINDDFTPAAAEWGLGLRQGLVVLVAHNPAWKKAFDVEAETIRSALGDWLIDVQHIGSTAVPTIRSKPILDIMVGIADFDQGPLLEPAMAEIGYDFAAHAGVPNDHIFGKGLARTHLVHVVEHNGAVWHHNLRFRDRLLADPDLAAAYDLLKGSLASQFGNSRAAYTEASSNLSTAWLHRSLPWERVTFHGSRLSVPVGDFG